MTIRFPSIGTSRHLLPSQTYHYLLNTTLGKDINYTPSLLDERRQTAMERIVNKQLEQSLANNEPHCACRLIHGDPESRLDVWRNLLVDSGKDTDVGILCGTLDEPTSKLNTLGESETLPPNRLQLSDHLRQEAGRVFYGENTWVVNDYQDLEQFAVVVGPHDNQYIHTLVFGEVFVTDSTPHGADGLTSQQRITLSTLRNHFPKVNKFQFRLTSWDYTMHANRAFVELLADLESVRHIDFRRPEICSTYAWEYAKEECSWLFAIRSHMAFKPGEMELDSSFQLSGSSPSCSSSQRSFVSPLSSSFQPSGFSPPPKFSLPSSSFQLSSFSWSKFSLPSISSTLSGSSQSRSSRSSSFSESDGGVALATNYWTREDPMDFVFSDDEMVSED